VAHATKGLPDHGALVSAAARSDCGKAAPTTTTAPTSAAPLAPTAPTTHGKAGKKEGNRAGTLTKAGKKEGNRGTLSGTSGHGKSAGKGKGHAKHAH
jgi:hypothetical protein